MTNFRPTTLSPEALVAWDEAEANILASMQRIRELSAPIRRVAEPGLKKRALRALDRHETFMLDSDRDIITRALEALPND
jgi:hypothetical protein